MQIKNNLFIILIIYSNIFVMELNYINYIYVKYGSKIIITCGPEWKNNLKNIKWIDPNGIIYDYKSKSNIAKHKLFADKNGKLVIKNMNYKFIGLYKCGEILNKNIRYINIRLYKLPQYKISRIVYLKSKSCQHLHRKIMKFYKKICFYKCHYKVKTFNCSRKKIKIVLSCYFPKRMKKSKLKSLLQFERKYSTKILKESKLKIARICPKGFEYVPPSRCYPCLKGTFKSRRSFKCVECPKNYYSNSYAASKCKQCRMNTITFSTGSKNCLNISSLPLFAKPGEKVELNCKSVISSSIHRTSNNRNVWERLDYVKFSAKRHSIKKNGNLLINKIQPSDYGIYLCNSKEIHLIVYSLPIQLVLSASNIIWNTSANKFFNKICLQEMANCQKTYQYIRTSCRRNSIKYFQDIPLAESIFENKLCKGPYKTVLTLLIEPKIFNENKMPICAEKTLDSKLKKFFEVFPN